MRFFAAYNWRMQTIFARLFTVLLTLLGISTASASGQLALSYNSSKVTKVADGLVLKKLSYKKLFNAKQTVNVIEVDLRFRSLKPLDFNGCQKISAAGPTTSVLAAVNGTFFGEDCSPRNLLKIDGNLLGTNVIRTAGSAAFLMDALRNPAIAMLGAQENPRAAEQGIGGFPQLVADGVVKIQPMERTNFFRHRYPRTSVGIIDDTNIIIVAVDGGTAQSAGFTIQELATYMQSYGAFAAINLDGGISTTMWIKNRGVVNRPSSARGEVVVANSLGIF